MDARLQVQRSPAPFDPRRQQGLDPYLSAQNRSPQYQDLLPSRQHIYTGGSRRVADEPPSPISFAARDPYPNTSANDEYITPNAPPHRERTNAQPQSRQHAFLDNPPEASSPAKKYSNDSGAKSTFSADDNNSVSNRSRTSSGGKKILKRMMKELGGGPKEPPPPLHGNPLSSKKEKVMSYGRGGAGRTKKKETATLAEKSKSTTSLASDDMKTLRSASSAAVKKSGKVVYDPYLKTMVGTRGITIPAAANPTVTATIPPPLPGSARSATPLSPELSAPNSSTFNFTSGGSQIGPSTAGSIPRPPSSRSGWDEEGIISDAWPSGRSRDHYTSPPPSAFTYSSGRTDPQGYPSPPPSEGRAPTAWRSHGIQRRPSELSLRTNNSATPTLDPNQLLIHSLLQQQSAPAIPLPPPQPTPAPDLATTLYAALLAQQTAIAPPAPSVQQPIIPPQLAGNLDSIIAAAAAYHQLLAAATGAGAALPAQQQDASNLPTPPVTIPGHPTGKPKDDVAALTAALASYSLSTPSTAGSSPSSVSALSPPPRHRQLRKGGHHVPTPPRRSSSPNTPPEGPKQLSIDNHAAPKRKQPFQNLVTPPATDDGNADLLSSRLSFSSTVIPSPAPSALTFSEVPPLDLIQQPTKTVRASETRSSRDELSSRSTPALTPSASSSSLSHSSGLLDAPAHSIGRNRSNTASQESFSSTRSNTSDKDQVSKAEKELLKLEKSLQSFRTLSSENMHKQYNAPPRAPSRASETPTPVVVSSERSRPLPAVKAPPPSSAGAALSLTATANAPRRPRKVSVSETDEEYYRRMHMALPPLPSAPSPLSHVNVNPPRKESFSTAPSTSQRSPAAPSPNFSTRPIQSELDDVPPSSFGRQQAIPAHRRPSAEALASRQPASGRSRAWAAELPSKATGDARPSILSPTLTEMDFPMPPSTIVAPGRPGAGAMVSPGPRKESLNGPSSTVRPRRDYI